MVKIYKIISLQLFLFLPFLSFTQPDYDSIKIVPQKNYKADEFHSFIFGSHWRNLWTAEISVAQLDLNNFAGGLKPIKSGGGMQTKSLQMQGTDGKIYKFRSIDKFPGRSLPDDFRGSIVESFLRDQITTINPFSSLIVSSLIEPTGILFLKSHIYLMPSSDQLENYNSEYGNMLGTIEEKADDYKNSSLNFAGSNKIIDTYKMFDKLEKDNDNCVIATDFLKARLFDIFVGDRDRHAGQWDWAEYLDGENKIYKPIPKDRDFAFPLYDGVIPRILSLAITSYVHFDCDMPSMLGLTWEGRHLDRRILAVLEKPKWDSVANYLQSVLTDEVITNAVNSLPGESLRLAGEELIKKLKSRRDQLKDASDSFYKLTSQYVDIHLSDKDEYVEINRIDNDFTDVKIFKREKKSGIKKNEIVYHRKFNHKDTEEIRVHLKDGDDKATITGHSNNPILIVVDGGNGDDELIDSSEVDSFNSKAKFYDSGKNTKFIISNTTYVNKNKYIEPGSESEKYEPEQEDRYHDFSLLVPFKISSDYGIMFGAGGGFNFYDYRISPYSYRIEAAGSYANLTGSYKLETNTFFNQLVDNFRIKLSLGLSQLEITRFYGIGNETIRDHKLNELKYYQVEQNHFLLSALFEYSLNYNIDLHIGSSFENSSIEEDNKEENSLLNDFIFYGEGDHSFLTFFTGVSFDYRDHKELPHDGYFLSLEMNYYPKTFNNIYSFLKSSFDIRTYIENNFITNNTISFKSLGEFVAGTYPFYSGANLGGSKGLRGFPTNRFVGDVSILFQSEVRVYLGKPRLIIPGKFGFKLFWETGRVFVKDEKSNMWNQSYGGGIYFDILDRFFSINFDVAASREMVRYYLYFTKSF